MMLRAFDVGWPTNVGRNLNWDAFSLFTRANVGRAAGASGESLCERPRMLHAALLVAALTSMPTTPVPVQTSLQRCFESMDGAVYHGDPSNRSLMKANVAACERGIAEVQRIRPTAAQGPEKLFLTGRILDRAATLSYMGLNDTGTAYREVKTANLYFRIAAGLPDQSDNYHLAAVANVTLTTIQLRTLRNDIAAAQSTRARSVAQGGVHRNDAHDAAAPDTATAYAP
jgi:hypothetical protein